MHGGHTIAMMALAIPLVAVLGGIALAIAKVLRGQGSPARRQSEEEEARMIQEMYHGLTQMEKRVEALETLLLDRELDRDGRRAGDR